MIDAALNPTYAVGSAYAGEDTMPTALDMASAVTGAINNAAPDQPIKFCFRYGEIPILGNILPLGGSYQLSVAATVGYMPYTAEDRDTRALLRSAVSNLQQTTNGAIYLNGQQAIIVSGNKKVEPPLTAVTVVSGLVSLMVETRPLFKAIGEFLPEVIDALPSQNRQ
jgi:hypothetical protein